MNRWYRAYEGTVTDPKLAEAALVAGCSRAVAIAAWHAILESAASCQDGGRFDTTARRVAVTLGERVPDIEALFAAMTELEMIADSAVTAWAKRQFESDNSTERSRKLRERRRNADATLRNADESPPDTDTEKNTSSLRSDDGAAVADPPAPMTAKSRLWAEGVPILETFGLAKQARGLIGRWLKQTHDDAFPILDAIQRARDHGVVDAVPWITASLANPRQDRRNDRSNNVSDAFDRIKARLDGRTDPASDSLERDDGYSAGRPVPGFAGRLL